MKKKECFKCGAEKPLTEFYKHPKMKDGHVNKCKECTKRDVRENRAAKVDYYREYDRRRGNRQSPEDQKEYRKRFPAKARARRMVAYNIGKGYMRRMPCEKCGCDKAHAHHDDYAYPLDVRWLCAVHHQEWHMENGEGKNG